MFMQPKTIPPNAAQTHAQVGHLKVFPFPGLMHLVSEQLQLLSQEEALSNICN